MLFKSIVLLLGSLLPADGFQPAPSYLHTNVMKKENQVRVQALFASSSPASAGDHDDIPPDVEKALKCLNSIVTLLGDDDEMRRHHGFSMTDYVMDRRALCDALTDAADKMEKVSRDTGIARTTGGAMGIVSGLAIIGGVVAAPFTAGTSAAAAAMAVTTAGAAGAVASAGTTATAAIIKTSHLQTELSKIGKKLKQIDEKEYVVSDMLKDMGESLDKIQDYVDNESSWEKILAFVTLRSKSVGWNVAYGSAKVVKGVRAVHYVNSLKNFFGVFTAKGTSLVTAYAVKYTAPGVAVKIPLATNSFTIVNAGTTTAQVLKGALGLFGIGFGVYDVVNGVEEIQGSVHATEFREKRNEYSKMTWPIVYEVYRAQVSVAGGPVDTYISDLVVAREEALKKAEKMIQFVQTQKSKMIEEEGYVESIHESIKSNAATGKNVKRVTIGNGNSYVNINGKKWVLLGKRGKELHSFSEKKRDETSVYLTRNSEPKREIQLDLEEQKIFWNQSGGKKKSFAKIKSVSKINLMP